MANKRQRKKNAKKAQASGRKKLGTYEGQQYRGGRGKGKKNLKKVDGGLQNKHGVTFTPEQKKALERAVDRSNYRRKKMLAREMAEHPEQDQLSDLRTMGKESVYSISRQSKSLQRFKSMEEYEHFMDKQARIQSGEYQRDRANAYRDNFINSMLDVYGPEAEDIAEHMRSMDPDEYMLKVAGDEVLEISFIPSDEKQPGRLTQLRIHLGLNVVPEWWEETIE